MPQTPRAGNSTATEPHTVREQRLRAMYDAFNARNIDAVLHLMTPDVDWPNAWEGGRIHGHHDLRAYWTRQWAALDPRVVPIAFTARRDGSIAVDVQQTVRDLKGTPLSTRRVRHVFVFRDTRIACLEVEGIV